MIKHAGIVGAAVGAATAGATLGEPTSNWIRNNTGLQSLADNYNRKSQLYKETGDASYKPNFLDRAGNAINNTADKYIKYQLVPGAGAVLGFFGGTGATNGVNAAVNAGKGISTGQKVLNAGKTAFNFVDKASTAYDSINGLMNTANNVNKP